MVPGPYTTWHTRSVEVWIRCRIFRLQLEQFRFNVRFRYRPWIQQLQCQEWILGRSARWFDSLNWVSSLLWLLAKRVASHSVQFDGVYISPFRKLLVTQMITKTAGLPACFQSKSYSNDDENCRLAGLFSVQEFVRTSTVARHWAWFRTKYEYIHFVPMLYLLRTHFIITIPYNLILGGLPIKIWHWNSLRVSNFPMRAPTMLPSLITPLKDL